MLFDLRSLYRRLSDFMSAEDEGGIDFWRGLKITAGLLFLFVVMMVGIVGILGEPACIFNHTCYQEFQIEFKRRNLVESLYESERWVGESMNAPIGRATD